jgi:hypothetical protein
MPASAPRVDSRLVAALRRLDDGELPVAELNRRLGSIAQALGLAQPSYQCVRLLVRKIRRCREVPGIGELLLDIALRNRPPEAILDYLSERPNQTL